MIKTLNELRFFIIADKIMNEQHFPTGIRKFIKYDMNIIHRFLRCLRVMEYLDYKSKSNKLFMPMKIICDPWTNEYPYNEEVERCENIRKMMGIEP